MKKAIIVGYGNVGKAVMDAIKETEDFTPAGIVDQLYAGTEIAGMTVVADIEELPVFDVAILALPSRLMPETAGRILQKGISTADGFDIHTQIPEVRKNLNAIAREHNAVSVLSAGWDPGTDSIIRTLLEAMAPRGLTYTNFGPGMSMGHTVAVKSIPGVKDALSMTIPTGTGIHRRMVYVELAQGAIFNEVAAAIKKDEYFIHDETHVTAVENVKALKDMGHGVHIERKGVSGSAQNQLFDYTMKINNPALTAQVLVCAARAALRQKPGCYTMIEIPPVDFLEAERDDAVHRLV